MSGSSLLNENLNGISDFDDFFKFLDFPLEDVEGNVGEDWNAKLELLDPPSIDVLAGLSPGFSGKTSNDSSKCPENLSAPCYETSPLEVLPVTAEATSNRSIVLHKASDGKGLRLFQTSSPISVLESSSSCSVENPTTVEPKIISAVKRARSKRSRPRQPNFNRKFVIPFFSSSPKLSHPSASFESGSETDLTETVSNPSKRKLRKKKNLTVLSGATETMDHSSQGPVATRKCMHCEVTKTPQWREGPMGPKTLCNACGVRYRSGRLFPEYRPMASPTFVPSVHSNSHKKVIEMRSKASLVAETF
ncbi:hypothetical protein F2P56_011205 [Juglans regia]|uniref:GATA transcription factor 10-like n=2 Tax=Juglans regia TaxID=51240 RepID=A0A2I4GK91_JUGRE|nr:GATA transcription factor 10-like [Juglans regia]XP_018844309.2 GATA transcription factor 10-like [Juglans regia]XP_035540845.1 GATA transcription factor 10-like [Juglans regia]XP_035540846.1 GATA transcription factor 10-like [Juglans regia]KAF5447415.1 hypothetical protein F2P56_032969 [Juglans regia]KAF5470708.1 hypothetical protein F2P56_011205 [Juglans regia]